MRPCVYLCEFCRNGQTCELKAESDNERERENGGFRRYYHRNRWSNNRRWQGPRYRKQTNGVHSESEQYEVSFIYFIFIILFFNIN